MSIEYRVCWNASSNISFAGKSDWVEANEDETAEEVEDALSKGGEICEGLELALGASGFEWWAETREASK